MNFDNIVITFTAGTFATAILFLVIYFLIIKKR